MTREEFENAPVVAAYFARVAKVLEEKINARAEELRQEYGIPVEVGGERIVQLMLLTLLSTPPTR